MGNTANAYIDYANFYYGTMRDIAAKGYKSYNRSDYFRLLLLKKSFFTPMKTIREAAENDSKKIEEDLGIEILKDKYKRASHLWEVDVPFSEWILYVKQYIEFIRYAEKCFLYRNESSIDREKSDYVVYCEDKENTLYIRYFPNDVKIKINFTESLVNDISIDITEENSIMDYVNSGKSPKRQINVEFVYMSINREFGKQMVNEFRFIISENPQYPDVSDTILMETMQTIIAKCIQMNFHEICDNYINKFARGDKHLKLGDLIDGAVLFGH